MLSKKECLIAFNGWKKACKIGLIDVVDERILLQLIDEHFDNPPLKFEELKVGMWVWDNKRKEWCVLSAFWKDALNRYYISGLSDSPFEENRFYRKQVMEE